MKVVIMLPTYNESENIGRLVHIILKLNEDYEIVAVDDDSPDGTGRILDEISVAERRVHVIHRQGRRGRGIAGAIGFVECLRLAPDAVVEMDADFSHDPGFIPELVSGLDGADLVIASRFVDGGRDLRGFFRRALSRFSNLYVKNVLGIAVRDCTSGFRAFSASALAGVKPGRLTSKGPSIVQEALLKCLSNGIRIKEVPYTFYERRSGRSKLSFKTLFKTLFVATGMALSYRLRGRLA